MAACNTKEFKKRKNSYRKCVLSGRVTDDYEPGDPTFNGRIEWVNIGLGDDAKDADHLIKHEELWHIAMARQ